MRNKQVPTENRLLRALPKPERRRLDRHITTVHLQARDVVYEPNRPIDRVYFPRNGIISLLSGDYSRSSNGKGESIEVATVGNEGMVGLPIFLGAQSIPGRAFCQVPGDADVMEATALTREVDQSAPMRAILHRYTQSLFNQVAQAAACNRLHTIKERCSRWLLMSHDRVGADEFLLTQQFLAQMLGVRRAGVNEVARALVRAGAVRYTRGRISILNRKKLESLSCGCYRVIREDYERLLAER